MARNVQIRNLDISHCQSKVVTRLGTYMLTPTSLVATLVVLSFGGNLHCIDLCQKYYCVPYKNAMLGQHDSNPDRSIYSVEFPSMLK